MVTRASVAPESSDSRGISTYWVRATPTEPRSRAAALGRVVSTVDTLATGSALKARHDAPILVDERVGLGFRLALRHHMELWLVRVGKHEHPLISQVDLDAVRRPGAPVAILLAQQPHDGALLVPGAGHVRLLDVPLGKLGDHVAEPRVRDR